MTPEQVKDGQLWSLKDKKQDATRFLRITKLSYLHVDGYTWWDCQSSGRATRMQKSTVVKKWTLVEQAQDGAA